MIETVAKERRLLRKLIRKSHNFPDQQFPADLPLIDPQNYYFKELSAKGFVEVASAEAGDDLEVIPITYRITEAGRHFYEKRCEFIKDTIIRGFMLPVLVSIVTTLITNGVIWLIHMW